MADTITLNFDGYYEEEDLPPENHDCAGIYVVYRGDDECLTELLYIGRSGDVDDRPGSTHHRYKDWKQSLQKNEVLYFTFADTDEEKRAEGALIFKIQPRLNIKGKESFNFIKTSIKITGKTDYLEKEFVVYPANN